MNIPSCFKALVVATMLFVGCVAAMADIKLNVNVKESGKIAGEFKFVVTAASNNLVTQVEFYVGSDLRETDESTPYEFTVDTLNEKEGPLKVTFAAYSNQGETAKKTITVIVDNELAKGEAYHVEQAKQALQDSKWDEAIQHGRIALKIKPGYNPARIALARANLGKGVYDSAQKFAEDAVTSEPKNAEALLLLSGINLQRAFIVTNRGGDRADTINAIRTAMKAAVDSRRKVLDNQIDSFGAVTDANRLQYADAAIQGARYSRAIVELDPVFRKDIKNSAVANRLIYAQLRAGRYREAIQNMETYRKYGQMDAYGNALAAIVYEMVGDREKSQNSEREAIASDAEDMGVRTAQAYLALVRANAGALRKLATDLSKNEGQRPEVLYYLSALNHQAGDYDLSRRNFEKAVLAEPSLYDIFIERANQSLKIASTTTTEKADIDYQLQVARAFLESAQAAKPDSFEALTGLSLVSGFEKKTTDALNLARSAIKAGPEYAPAYYAFAAIASPEVIRLRNLASAAQAETSRLRAARQYDAAAKSAQQAAAFGRQTQDLVKEQEQNLAAATRLDKANLTGVSTPTMLVAWQHFYRYGRTPLIAAPK